MAHIIICGIAITVERLPEWKRKALKEAAKVKYVPRHVNRTKRLQDFL